MERREIDSRYKWDLTDIYENGGAWEEALNSLRGWRIGCLPILGSWENRGR